MKNHIFIILSLLCWISLSSQDISIDTTTKNYIQLNENSYADNPFKLDAPTSHNRSRLFEILRGKVSGLEINASSGGPGSSISGVFRGYNSIINNNSPLIILDGMIISNDEFNSSLGGVDQTNRAIDINSNDIASFTVLKGSVGAAKYGIRGSNGVIELTTKSINQEGLSINYSTSLAVSKTNKLIALQDQYAQGINNAYYGPETKQGFSWGPPISELEYDGDNTYLFSNKGRLVPNGQGIGQAAEAFDPYLFLNSAISHDHNLSIGKRSNSYAFRISGGANYSNGVIPTTFYNRHSISANLMAKPINKLTVNAGVRYVSSSAYKNIKGSSTNGIMLGLTRTSPSFDNTNGLSPTEALNNESAYILSDGSQRSYRHGVYDNPYWSINKNPNNNNTSRIIGNVAASYKINEQYKITYFTGIDKFSEDQIGGISPQTGFFNPGSAYSNNRAFSSTYQKATIETTFNPNEKLAINAEIGSDFYIEKTNDDLQNGFGIDQGLPIDITNTNSIDFLKNYSRKATFGTYINSQFVWNNFIDFQIVGRYDKSSALGKNADDIFSYGLNANFDILKIGLDPNQYSPKDDKLYFSLGVGRTGNDIPGSINRRTLQPLQISGDGFVSFTTINNLMEINNFAINHDLSAEITDAIEVGFKTVNLENRLILSAKIFYEKTSDVIRIANIDNTSGYDFMLFNDYAISNKGFEIDLWGKLISSTDFDWTISANLSKNNSKILSSKSEDSSVTLDGFSSVNTSIIVEEPYGVLTGSSFSRDIEGNLILASDGLPFININNAVIGNPIPEFLLNITNEITIKDKLTFSGLIDIRSGGDVWCGTCGVLDYFGRTELAANERDQEVVFEGVNQAGQPNTVPANLADSNEAYNNYYRVRYGFGGISEMNIYDASWIRLREINVSYEVLTHTDKFIKSIKLGVFAHNLLLISDYPGIDPETNVSGTSNGRGIDYFNNPNTKSFGFTINASF